MKWGVARNTLKDAGDLVATHNDSGKFWRYASIPDVGQEGRPGLSAYPSAGHDEDLAEETQTTFILDFLGFVSPGPECDPPPSFEIRYVTLSPIPYFLPVASRTALRPRVFEQICVD